MKQLWPDTFVDEANLTQAVIGLHDLALEAVPVA